MCNSNYYAFQDDGRAILNKLPLLIAFILFFVLWGFFGFIFFFREGNRAIGITFCYFHSGRSQRYPFSLKVQYECK